MFEEGIACQPLEGWHELEHVGAERFRWLEREARLAARLSGGRRTLALLLEPGPSLGYQTFELLVRSDHDREIAHVRISGLSYVEIPLPPAAATRSTLFVTAEGGGVPEGSDPRTLAFRIFACGLSEPEVAASPAIDETPPGPWSAKVVVTRPPAINWPSTLAKWRQQIADMGKPICLHLYACGDFTLMAREHWLEVRGYAELDRYSMHLDSILCYAAHHAGAREELLPEGMRIYHIEHGIGSGWTPEGQDVMYARMERKSIPVTPFEELTGLIAQMRMLHAPVILNLEDWGLAKISLPEEEPAVVAPATAP